MPGFPRSTGKIEQKSLVLVLFINSQSDPKSSAQLAVFWMPINRTKFTNLKTDNDITEAVTICDRI